jgi:DNA-binding transcriptional LysR family regulator
MMNLRHHAHTAIRELRDLHRGKLTLSANEYTVMGLLPLIPTFRARHPHIKIEVKRSLASRIPSEILGTRCGDWRRYLQAERFVD